MTRNLATGYVLCAATLVAMLALALGAIPRIGGLSALFHVILAAFFMLLASVLCFLGARPSSGHSRKAVAYLVSVFSLLVGLGCLALALALLSVGPGKLG